MKDMVKDVVDEEVVHGLNVRDIRNTNDCKKDVICVPGSVDYVYWIVEKETTAWLKNQKQVLVQNSTFHTLMYIVQTNTSARHLLEFSKNIWSKEGFSFQESVLTFQSNVVNLDDYLHLNKETSTYIVNDQTTVYNIRYSGLLWDCLGCTKGYTNCNSFLKHKETCGHNWSGIQGAGSYDWGRTKGNYSKTLAICLILL